MKELTSGDVKFEWLKFDAIVTPNHSLSGHHRLFSVPFVMHAYSIALTGLLIKLHARK